MNRYRFVSDLKWRHGRHWCAHSYCLRMAHPDNPKGECWDPKGAHRFHRYMVLERAQARMREEIDINEELSNFGAW